MQQFRPILTALAILCPALLFGCSPWAPEKVEILVGTLPPGASCLLTRAGQPLATAGPTPAIAVVEPAPGEVTVACRRSGFRDAAVTLPPAQVSGGPYLFTSPSPLEYQRQVEIALVPR